MIGGKGLNVAVPAHRRIGVRRREASDEVHRHQSPEDGRQVSFGRGRCDGLEGVMAGKIPRGAIQEHGHAVGCHPPCKVTHVLQPFVQNVAGLQVMEDKPFPQDVRLQRRQAFRGVTARHDAVAAGVMAAEKAAAFWKIVQIRKPDAAAERRQGQKILIGVCNPRRLPESLLFPVQHVTDQFFLGSPELGLGPAAGHRVGHQGREQGTALGVHFA